MDGARDIFEGKREKCTGFLVRICEGKKLFEDLCIEGTIISKRILKKLDGRACNFMLYKMWRICD